MTDCVQGFPRQQQILLPDTLDDHVLPGSAVRFIDSFVNHLDLAGLGVTHAELKETGRPPFHPGDLLKLYLYGYLNGSARAANSSGNASATSR